eukprot:GHRR01004981.1.p1 GENE.GHRR01004981.1~~GHRR01004981.1.p1  ORF type:complete len:1930 (+),score=738.37 GHRR01004981.1:486-5792(+)
MPSAAGIYLPAGHAGLEECGRQPAAGHSSDVAGAVGRQTGTACLSANHNAFVVAPFTARLTAAYQSATLSRWQLLGLSSLAGQGRPAAGAGSALETSADCSSPRVLKRGCINRRPLICQRWQRVLELRAFARCLDYAMFLLCRQDSKQQLPRFASDAAEIMSAHPFEQYQLLYSLCLHEADATAVPAAAAAAQFDSSLGKGLRQPGGLRNGKNSSLEGGFRWGTAAGSHTLEASSPCNWRSNSMRRSITDRLLAVEQSLLPLQPGSSVASPTTAAPSAATSTSPRAGVSLQGYSTTSSSFAGGWLDDSLGSAMPDYAEAPASVSSIQQAAADQAINGTAGSSQSPAKAMQEDPTGFQVFTALRALRSGSESLLQSAAKQLRQRTQKQQRRHGLPADTRSHRAISSLSPMARHSRFLSVGEEASSMTKDAWSAVPAYLRSYTHRYNSEVRGHSLQQQGASSPEFIAVDFLNRFQPSNCFAADNGSNNDQDRSDAQTAGYVGSAWQLQDRSRLLYRPQFVVTYAQRPAELTQSQQAANSSLAADARYSEQEEHDSFTVSVSHVKLVVGPHSVSMLLQLISSITAAASGARSSHKSGTAGTAQASAADVQVTSELADYRLHVRVQLAVCHVVANMERAVLPGSINSTSQGQLQTNGLLSLLLLDADSSVQRVPLRQSADALVSPLGVQASCSLAHIGMQDLSACVEQRHVLAGANDAHKAANTESLAAGKSHKLGRTQACQLSVRVLMPAESATAEQPMQLLLLVHNPRLLLVRRFANNVVYVMALINHEVQAAAPATGANSSQPTANSAAASGAKPVAAVRTSAVVQMTNLQVLLPKSHACKAPGNKYDKALAMRNAAKQRHAGPKPNNSSNSTSSSLAGAGANSSCESRHSAALCAANLYSNMGSRASLQRHCPLYAQHLETMVLQAEQATIMMPGSTALLLQQPMNSMQDGHSVPEWMMDPEVVQNLLAESKAILSSVSASPDGKQQADQQQADQPQQQQQEEAAKIAGQDGAPTAAGRSFTTSSIQHLQPAPRQQPQAATGQSQDDSSPQCVPASRALPSAAVRHGVLLLTDNASMYEVVDSSEASQFSIRAAASHLWQKVKSKIMPRSWRLVVRHNEMLPGPVDVVTGSRQRSAAIAGAAALAAARHTRQRKVAVQAASAAGITVDHLGQNEALHAQLLVDLQGAELLAGQMCSQKNAARQRYPGSNSMDETTQGSLVADSYAGSIRQQSWCDLTQLRYLLSRTYLQMALHSCEPVAAAANAGLPATAPAPTSASTTAAAGLTSTGADTVPVTVLAFASPDGLALQLEACNYQCLMDTIFGNLMHKYSSFDAGSVHVGVPSQYQTDFNPQLKFGPKPGQVPTFGVTLSSSAIQATFLANSRWWSMPAHQQSGNGATAISSSSAALPCVSAALRDAGVCFHMVKGTWDTHVHVWAADTEWLDVRLANYSMAPVPQAESQQKQQQMAQCETAAGVGLSERHCKLGARLSQQNVAKVASYIRPTAVGCEGAVSRRPLTGIRGRKGAHQLSKKPIGPEAFDVDKGVSPALTPKGSTGQDLQQKPKGGLPAATNRPAHLFPRPQRLAHQESASGHKGSIQGISSDEAAGEQQLGAYDLFPSLLQPSSDGSQHGADISIIRVLDELPAEESAHLASKGRRAQAGANGLSNAAGRSGVASPNNLAAFKLHFGYLAEGTMTVQVALAHALLQWPYLSDLSIVSAIISIFNSNWGLAPQLPPAWLQLKRLPWLYFNLVLTDSQVRLNKRASHKSC